MSPPRSRGRLLLIALASAASVSCSHAIEEPDWRALHVADNAVVELPTAPALEATGRLEHGVERDTSWAHTRALGCWPAEGDAHFDGRHVLYVTRLPPGATLTAELLPDDPTLDLSLYAYGVEEGEGEAVPPASERIARCQSSHLLGVRSPAQRSNPGSQERIRLASDGPSYRVVIGVVGAFRADAGPYRLRLRTRPSRALTAYR